MMSIVQIKIQHSFDLAYRIFYETKRFKLVRPTSWFFFLLAKMIYDSEQFCCQINSNHMST